MFCQIMNLLYEVERVSNWNRRMERWRLTEVIYISVTFQIEKMSDIPI